MPRSHLALLHGTGKTQAVRGLLSDLSGSNIHFGAATSDHWGCCYPSAHTLPPIIIIMGERWRKGNHVLQWKMAPEEPPWYWKMCCVLKNRKSLPNTAPPNLKKKTPWQFSAPQNKAETQIKKACLPTTKTIFRCELWLILGSVSGGIDQWNRPHLQRPKNAPPPKTTPPR